MREKKLERAILFGIARLSNKNAESCKSSGEPPWPECPIIFHQPKRPQKKL